MIRGVCPLLLGWKQHGNPANNNETIRKTTVKMSTKRPQLTAKEEEIMHVFWQHGPLFVKEILDYLPDPKPHVNTVSTVVRVLEGKGYVGHEKKGGSYRYHALLLKENYRKTTLREMLKNYFDNSFKSMVSALVEEEQLDPEELKEVIDIIEKKR